MNTKAKQRAWRRSEDNAPERAPVVEAARFAPLAAPKGLQLFDVGLQDEGERLDRFLGRAAAARRIALSRTRLKVLIEAGEVRV
ncbi:MAG TPA: hypothetical protein VKR62_15455, partial [Roseiarcus sp.]|nr:hypothetical protein [Roseiarcus sp.]